MRMLITGASGFLGSRVAARAAAAGATVVGTHARASTSGPLAGDQLDVRNADAVTDLVHRVGPDVVVHTAAGRDDWRLIADGSAYVATAAAAIGARLVHLSTDALFSGRDGEYDETAAPDPIYPYGAAKAAAETAVAAVHPAAAIVRTSLILGGGRPTQPLAVPPPEGQHERLTRGLIAGRVPGALYTDVIRKPVHVDDLAAALLELAVGDHRGILNVAGPDALSRYELGVLIARRDGLDPARIPAATTTEAGVRLPTDVRLDTALATALLVTRLRGAREFLVAAARAEPPTRADAELAGPEAGQDRVEGAVELGE